jgi:hypothetical protein
MTIPALHLPLLSALSVQALAGMHTPNKPVDLRNKPNRLFKIKNRHGHQILQKHYPALCIIGSLVSELNQIQRCSGSADVGHHQASQYVPLMKSLPVPQNKLWRPDYER